MSLRVEIEKRLGNFTLQAEFETREQTLALLGASGCGKSVTLKCIAGIMTPDKGRIELDGEVLFDAEKGINLPPQKRRVGYLFQQYALFPNMTVVQNIRCGIRARGAERERLVREQMRRFQLEGLEKSYPAQLSGGQQQRVALARILAGEPKAILLDEPFSALDSYLKWSLEAELTQMLANFTGPLVWVSHDLGECWRNCRTVCVLEQGRTGPVTDLETLVHRPATVEQARLAGCRNIYPVRLTPGGLRVPGWEASLPLPDSAEAGSMLGIPAEAVRVGCGGTPWTVCRAVRDLEWTEVLLRPEGATADAPVLCARLDLDQAVQVGETVTVSFDPARLLVLKERTGR